MVEHMIGQGQHSSPLHCHIDRLTDIEHLETRWRALEEKCDVSFFLTWAWIGTWASLVNTPLYLFQATKEGQDVALALLGFGHRRYGWLSLPTVFLNQSGNADEDKVFIEYNGLLVGEADKAEASRSFLTTLAATSSRSFPVDRWRQIYLAGLQDDALVTPLPSGVDVGRVVETPGFYVDLNDVRAQPNSYLDCLSRNSRQSLQRSKRLLSEQGEILLRNAESKNQALDWFDAMVRLQCEVYQDKSDSAALSQPFIKSFLKRLIERHHEAGHVHVLKCESGSEALGYFVNFCYNNSVLNYQTAFIATEDNRLKPGLTCHVFAIEHYAEAGFDYYDLLAGDSQYKRSLSTHTSELKWVTLRKKSALFKLDILFGKERARLDTI